MESPGQKVGKRDRVRPYLLAAGLSVFAVLAPWIAFEHRATQFLFFPVLAVAATALYGGVGPGLVATLVWATGATLLYSHHSGAAWISDPFEALRLLGVLVVSCAVALACGLLRTAYARARTERLLALDLAERLERQRTATKHAVQLRDETLALVSHDLRTPLATIALTGEALRRQTAADKAALERWGQVLRNAVSGIERLVRDLVDARELESGQLSVHPALTEPAQLARQIADSFRDTFLAAGISLELQIGDQLPVVRCDAQRIVQVLSNLLNNAAKATPSGGRVRLVTEAREEHVRFAVEDTGCGIDPDDLPHVFERFRRGGHASYAGSGLGLAIARGLVEMHGGQIGINSIPGAGTIVWFTLPPTPPPSSGTDPSNPPARGGHFEPRPIPA